MGTGKENSNYYLGLRVQGLGFRINIRFQNFCRVDSRLSREDS